ncbi:MAG TPA: alpha/beta hydrolase, partial [Acidimicrobiales bacterium]
SRRLKVNGVDLAWSERGSGPTLVLCHGFTGSSHDFSEHIDALAADRRVVTVDHRGHGQSTKTKTLEGYSVEHLSSDLAAFIEAVGEGPVDLLGHSMGGRMSLHVVLDRPDLVGSLILMDTSAWSFVPPDETIRALVRAWIEAFDPAQGMPEKLGPFGPEDALIEAAMPAEWLAEKQRIFSGMDAYAVKALGLALMVDMDLGETSLRADLPSITCPTTVIAGENDHPLVDQAPELAAEVADGTLVVIPGAYHSPQLTHAGLWRAAVEDHLTRADAARTAS